MVVMASHIKIIIAVITIAIMSAILVIAKRLQYRRARILQESRPAGRYVIVYIPENILPMQRQEKYIDPLNVELQKGSLGTAAGAGTQMSSDHTIQGLDIEVFLYEASFEEGISCLVKKLQELGAPLVSSVKYTEGSVRVAKTLAEIRPGGS